MDKLRLFWNNPVNTIFSWIALSKLPLLWKVRAANWNIRWWAYKRHFKDQFLGELVVVTVSVDKDWETVQGKHTVSLVRDITYRYKRKNLPFTYRKLLIGTQVKDETAYPLNRVPHESVAAINDSIFEHNLLVTAMNERRESHQAMRESIINHKFQEYDHETKN